MKDSLEDILYTSIYNHLIKEIKIEEEYEKRFIDALVKTATEGVQEYVRDLEEAVAHLQDTVKRLSHVDS